MEIDDIIEKPSSESASTTEIVATTTSTKISNNFDTIMDIGSAVNDKIPDLSNPNNGQPEEEEEKIEVNKITTEAAAAAAAVSASEEIIEELLMTNNSDNSNRNLLLLESNNINNIIDNQNNENLERDNELIGLENSQLSSSLSLESKICSIEKDNLEESSLMDDTSEIISQTIIINEDNIEFNDLLEVSANNLTNDSLMMNKTQLIQVEEEESENNVQSNNSILNKDNSVQATEQLNNFYEDLPLPITKEHNITENTEKIHSVIEELKALDTINVPEMITDQSIVEKATELIENLVEPLENLTEPLADVILSNLNLETPITEDFNELTANLDDVPPPIENSASNPEKPVEENVENLEEPVKNAAAAAEAALKPTEELTKDSDEPVEENVEAALETIEKPPITEDSDEPVEENAETVEKNADAVEEPTKDSDVEPVEENTEAELETIDKPPIIEDSDEPEPSESTNIDKSTIFDQLLGQENEYADLNSLDLPKTENTDTMETDFFMEHTTNTNMNTNTEEEEEEEVREGGIEEEEEDDKVAENDILNNKQQNIEFAEVNIQDDAEKDASEDKDEGDAEAEAEEGSTLEAAPSIPDILESIDHSEGVDEAITIIPDGEREISDAEKEAASILPKLKDISDNANQTVVSTTTTTTTIIPEQIDLTLDDLKVYPYVNDEEQQQDCSQCKEKKLAKYYFSNNNNAAENVLYICSEEKCLTLLKSNSSKNVQIISDEITAVDSPTTATSGGLKDLNNDSSTASSSSTRTPPEISKFSRKCAQCMKEITDDIDTNLTWEIMDFCNEICLAKYQKIVGAKCTICARDVKATCLGKYCVRFGNDIRQFCQSSCLEQYKKGLKVCSYCQQDMSNRMDGFLAPVGEKGLFKDFCSKLCMEKYDIMTNDLPPKVDPGTACSVCKLTESIKIEFNHENNLNYFCGEPCFVAFSFVNKIAAGKCGMCRRYFSNSTLAENTMCYDSIQYSFCTSSCKNIYIIAHRRIVPCTWCKVKKYNFDMIKKYSKTDPTAVINMCSINCFNMYQLSMNAVNAKPLSCNYCKKLTHPAYHLTMSDATLRNFCSYACVMNFQNKFPKSIQLDPVGGEGVEDPTPTGSPLRTRKFIATTNSPPTNVSLFEDAITSPLPVITNVHSLATSPPPLLISAASQKTGKTPLSQSTTSSTTTTTKRTRIKITTSSIAAAAVKDAAATTAAIPQNEKLSPPVPVPVPPPPPPPTMIKIKQHFIIKEKPAPEQRNVGVMCQTKKLSKGTQNTPLMKDASQQTDAENVMKIIVPVPIPIYVPTPCHMFSTPVPFPVPFPLPIPVPIFIPTTRNSAAGIMKEIKKIQVKIPTDPYEAELLMMAEMVAEEKKEDHTDSESDLDDNNADTGGGGDGTGYSPETSVVDTNNTFGDDVIQMALKMATELNDPPVDLEGALTASTITAPQQQGNRNSQQQQQQQQDVENVDNQNLHSHLMEQQQQQQRTPLRGRKRGIRGGSPRGASKRGRRMSSSHQQQPQIDNIPSMMQQSVPTALIAEPQEKPDANMCLKYTFGVNAWKQWVTTKNAELEKSTRRLKLFKTEILQLTADELNYSLCLFVKEVRKPNGQEYAPDTIYYLCLGIQQYLYENGRIDNIFCDPYYEKFTDCLDEVAKKFSVLYNDSHYIVTRVEEEHLWESKQLGAHSPHILLSTLMFFNTKHFNLTTVDEHMQLSFSHIMKHWKRNPNAPGASKVPGSRNVLLRFYPPQSALQNNQRKKKVYEQQENEENPLRCPVKLYEFYLSKCPESVKTRNDVFYLQPERSCVPDSPVWYSTMPLAREALEKMLHRVKMVKEINVALLTS